MEADPIGPREDGGCDWRRQVHRYGEEEADWLRPPPPSTSQTLIGEQLDRIADQPEKEPNPSKSLVGRTRLAAAALASVRA